MESERPGASPYPVLSFLSPAEQGNVAMRTKWLAFMGGGGASRMESGPVTPNRGSFPLPLTPAAQKAADVTGLTSFQ